MKSLGVLCLLLAPLVACQKEKLVEAEVDAYPQTWQLVKLTGQIPNYSKTGADLPMQERYVFEADSTFTKTRQQDGQLSAARGVFSFQDLSDGRYLVLTYEAANPIIGACTTEPKETLSVRGDDTLVSTWLACDGPGLEYKQVKVARAK